MGGVGRSVHTFRHGFLVKFRKSPHWTEKSLRHAQKPATPRSANPCGPESTSVTPGKDPPMATPPQGRKMAPERPFPILIETGKSYSKTGLFQRFSRRFSRQVRRGFSGGFPAVFRAVFRQFSDSFLGKFDAGFPTVWPASSTAIRQPFSGNTLSLDQPPVRLRPLPSIRKKRQETSAIPYTLSRLQTQHSGIFKSVFVTKRLAKLAGTNKN